MKFILNYLNDQYITPHPPALDSTWEASNRHGRDPKHSPPNRVGSGGLF